MRLSDKGEALIAEERTAATPGSTPASAALTVDERTTLREASDLLERLASE